MEIDKIIEEILKVDKKAFVTALQEKAKPFYQQVFNEGHASATGTFRDEKKVLTDKVKESEDKIVELQGEFDAYKTKAPDTATLDKQWGDKLEAEKLKMKNYKEQIAEERKTEKRISATVKLHNLLAGGDTGVDAEYADALVNKPSYQSRLSFDESGNLRVLQAGQEIPFAGNEEAQLKALAEEIDATVKPIYRRSTAGSGSGRSNTSGGSAAGGKSKWADIREKAKADNPSVSGTDRQAELNKRFGKSVPV